MASDKDNTNPFPEAPVGSLRYYYQPFGEYLRMIGRTEQGVETYLKMLVYFMAFCEERGVSRIEAIRRQVVERYQHHLFHREGKSGRRLAYVTQRNYLKSVQLFFKWLCKRRLLEYNPASELEMPNMPHTLPRAFLSQREVEQVLAGPDTKSLAGIRDRTILELFYATGMRRMEVVGLKVCDVDFARGVVYVRKGKGRRQRVVPLGERAAAWLERYLSGVRPHYFVLAKDDGHLFLTVKGEPFSLANLGALVGRYVQKAEVGKKGACHLFRHSVATLMLEGGADVRFVQAFLGHASLQTTQLYTHVTIEKLKEVYRMAHPGERDFKNPLAPPPGGAKANRQQRGLRDG